VTIRKIQIRETKGEIEADKRKHKTDRNRFETKEHIKIDRIK